MIRWFARNHIAANFLMLAIMLAGVWSYMKRVPLEVQPSLLFNEVRIEVEYRGGSPADVEKAVVIPVEQALEGLPGVKVIESDARSGSGQITLEARDNTDVRDLLDEVNLRMERIPALPPETEPPRVYIPDTAKWFDVIKVAVTGEMDEPDLVKAARRIRDDLQELPGISQALIQGETRPEISIEADLERLRDFGLGFADLADAVRRSSVDLPAGNIITDEGNMIIRTKGQAYDKEGFAEIVIRNDKGADVRLEEVARINDGYEENRKLLRFNGKPALLVEVLRLNEENALQIADRVKQYVAQQNERFPEGIELFIWDDSSVELRGRLGTLAQSMLQGGFLVILVLGLFLRPSLAFWVVLGIPVAFSGGLLALPEFDLTLNTMSIFGFIIVIGLVVDDAIVTSEHVYTKLRAGEDPLEAAVTGAKEVAVPVTFGALTTIVAFLPLLSFEGFYGNYTRQIPPVVAAVLIFSLIETKLILPCHLKSIKVGRTNLGPFARFQKMIADGLEQFVERAFRPSLAAATRHRYTTLAVFIAVGITCFGYVASGRMGFVNMPSIDRNRITAMLRLPRDTPLEVTDEHVRRIEGALNQIKREFVDPGTGQPLILDVLTSTGGYPAWSESESDEGFILASILDPGDRSEPGPRNSDIAKRWKELVGPIPEARSFWISGDRGRRYGGGDELESIEIKIRGPNNDLKAELAERVEETLESYAEISSAWSDIGRTRNEIHLSLKPEGESLGLTQRDLGRQVRGAFFGEMAQRVQRDRDDIRVMVRLPREQRESLQTLEDLRIRTPDGGTPPLHSVANVELVPANARIRRIDGAQVTSVAATPVDENVNVIQIAESVRPRIDAIINEYPEYSWVFDGYVREHEETGNTVWLTSVALFLALYALLAIPFRSLAQPFVVLLAVPFGIIGALAGHLILDITPSYLSIFGMLALAGVVVNDSLVMVDFTNQRRRNGDATMDAVVDAGSRRFRPIILTSLTTFVGLLPLMLDRSLQAQFLIPMAVSLGFGILFATFITLYLVPSAYLVMEDILRTISRAWAWYKRPFSDDPEPAPRLPASSDPQS
ncbi:efflux RND transporter permease subunit [Haloferula sp. A504]|uniref:efflux RND transporter permease subunit n=1 Tax=Haloferula sp. A504 TaxID=3373601 RepID=UPI0031C3579D|nr:efflux RND transporter permease subunit [Verrucomicrobiaceae bacterium E54]